MTAIAALLHDGKIYMGGDSAGVNVDGLALHVRKDPKVFINGPFIMGFTTSFRMGQLLRFSFTPPDHPGKMSIDRFMNTVFVDAVRKCLKKGGYAKVHSNVESGGTFLIGYMGKLYVMYDDYQIGISAANYESVGCGGDLCRGSLHATEGTDIEPKKRIKMALQAAEAFSGGVRGPFTIKSL